MSDNKDEAFAKVCQEIEKLQLENRKLREDWLELSDQMLSFTGLPGHLHRLDEKIKRLRYRFSTSRGIAKGGGVNGGQW